MPGWQAAASLGGSIVGGLFGRSGQSSANRTNIKLAREQMDFQERMSNTAYQRATVDLERAGLNRIMALGSPASSPAGQTATVQNENAAALQGALTAAQIYATRQAGKASAKQAERSEAQTKIMGPLSEVAESVTNFISSAKQGAGEAGADAEGVVGKMRQNASRWNELFGLIGERVAGTAKGFVGKFKGSGPDPWMDEPQRIQAKINQLERGLAYGDENRIWRRDSNDRENLVEKIKKLRQQLNMMKGPGGRYQ